MSVASLSSLKVLLWSEENESSIDVSVLTSAPTDVVLFGDSFELYSCVKLSQVRSSVYNELCQANFGRLFLTDKVFTTLEGVPTYPSPRFKFD